MYLVEMDEVVRIKKAGIYKNLTGTVLRKEFLHGLAGTPDAQSTSVAHIGKKSMIVFR